MYWYIFKYITNKNITVKLRLKEFTNSRIKNLKIVIIKNIYLETIYFFKYRKFSLNFTHR